MQRSGGHADEELAAVCTGGFVLSLVRRERGKKSVRNVAWQYLHGIKHHARKPVPNESVRRLSQGRGW